jgi:hypothetical protein
LSKTTHNAPFGAESLVKSKEIRRRVAALINVDSVPKKDREYGQIASRKDSIVWFCRSCMGYDAGGLGSVAANVRACPAYHCPLWPWRNGSLDEDATTTGGWGDQS